MKDEAVMLLQMLCTCRGKGGWPHCLYTFLLTRLSIILHGWLAYSDLKIMVHCLSRLTIKHFLLNFFSFIADQETIRDAVCLFMSGYVRTKKKSPKNDQEVS